MKRYHTATIARLLERYMAGTTTLSEERQLERYFLTATDIPREWAVYQTMFAQFYQLAQYARRQGVSVTNLSVNSYVDVFPKSTQFHKAADNS